MSARFFNLAQRLPDARVYRQALAEELIGRGWSPNLALLRATAETLRHFGG